MPNPNRFRMRIGLNHFLVVVTNSVGISVEYFAESVQKEPDWTMWLDYSDNPQLKGLRHSQFGWDLVGLARLFWAHISSPNQVPLSGEVTKPTATVSAPYLVPTKQDKRSTKETRELILAYVRDNPNCTRLDIAKALERSKTPYLLGQIEVLVKNGALARTRKMQREGRSEYRYVFVGRGRELDEKIEDFLFQLHKKD